MEIAANASTVDDLFKKVLLEIKADWKHNFVVFPFLRNQEMAQYM